MRKLTLGDKVYMKNEDGTFEILRIVKLVSDLEVKVMNTKTKKEFKMKTSIIEQEFKRLTPDGNLIISEVNLDNKDKDVIVSLYRKCDIENKSTPYTVCRQSVVDFFHEYGNKEVKDILIGVSCSIDTIPSNIPFMSLLSCNGVGQSCVLSVYLDDRFEEWFALIPERLKNKCDSILNTKHESGLTVEGRKLLGTVTTLKELLIQNNFMYDFRKAFNIDMVEFNIEVQNVQTLELDSEQRKYLENLYKVEMFKTYVIPFTKEFNMREIKRNYVMVQDISEQIFIIAYDKGEYINDELKAYQREREDMINDLQKIRR